MNLFSTDVYLETLADIRFPRRKREIAIAVCGGQPFRLLFIDGEPVTAAPFLDFFQPLPPAAAETARKVGYLPHAALETTTVEQRTPEPPGHHPAPFIEWSRFADWPAFQAMVGARIGNLFPDSRRRRK